MITRTGSALWEIAVLALRLTMSCYIDDNSWTIEQRLKNRFNYKPQKLTIPSNSLYTYIYIYIYIVNCYQLQLAMAESARLKEHNYAIFIRK